MDNAALESLLIDPERQTEARARLRDVVDAMPRTLNYMQWLQRLPAGGQGQPVAVLSSFTIQTIDPFLRLECYLSGWQPRISYVEYGLWQNALVSPASSGTADARAVVLLLHETELLDEERPDAEAAASHLKGLVDAFRRQSAAPLFIGLVEVPLGPPSIAFGGTAFDHFSAARRNFRRRVEEFLAEVSDGHLLELPPALAGGIDPTAFLSQRLALGHAALPQVARCIARTVACVFRPRRKILVLDLDNTLWGGVVGEDGVDGVAIGQEHPGSAYMVFQRQLLRLRSSGILLALASKNNEQDARAVFDTRAEMVLQWNHFTAHAVNWNDKASNIAAMAKTLGLGLDSFVFADDSPIECALVRQALPQVEVVELGKEAARFGSLLFRVQAFDALHVSDEDRQRADSYTTEADRRDFRERTTDLEGFLAGCELRLSIQPVAPGNVDRAHQLLCKTNQFNFSLERPAKEQLIGWMQAGDTVYTAALKDRFGDYGLIGVLHLDAGGQVFRISNMALSCRALGRGVEDALLAYARDLAVAHGRAELYLRCVRGPRNQQVFDYIERSGFHKAAEDEGAVDYALALTESSLPWPDFLQVELPKIPMGV